MLMVDNGAGRDNRSLLRLCYRHDEKHSEEYCGLSGGSHRTKNIVTEVVNRADIKDRWTGSNRVYRLIGIRRWTHGYVSLRW
jgi:hypothetical protein